MRTVRLFVSSPGDLDYERRRVERVAARLNGEFANVARIETIRWEENFYTADRSFQPQIPEAASCDIVVAVFWSRLGSELPPDFPHMSDGEPYPSGSAYEVLSALKARESGPLPDIFVFRKLERPRFAIDDKSELSSALAQWDRLQAFFERWFRTAEGHFLAAFQTFRHTDEFEELLEKLLRKWLEEQVLHGRSLTWPIALKGSPFCGLAPFDVRHAPVFFGRSGDLSRAVDRLKVAAEHKTPFLLLVGASGAGKSSLARAGLLPRLTTPGVVGDVDIWRTAVTRPGAGASPFDALAEVLLARAAIDAGDRDLPVLALPELADGDYKTPSELAMLMRSGAPAALPIVRALDRVAENERGRGGFERAVRVNLLLVVDQLDELFAADVAAADRSAFATLLRALVGSGRVWVIATLRAALYEPYLVEADLKALKDGGADYTLAAPGAAELGEIVRRPAEAAGLIFERGARGISLDDRLLADAAGADTLPLLQFTLQRLFEERQVVGDDTVLTIAAYDAFGGIDGAIDQAAERALSTLAEDARAALPRFIRGLAVPVSDGAAAGRRALTIRSVALSEIAPDPASRKLADALVEARILLLTEEGGVAAVRLAHQRVLESWRRARDIIASAADFLRIRDEVDDQRRRWQASGRKSELLIPAGLPLAEAESIRARFGVELGADAQAFIATSSRRARRRQRLIGAAAAAFALVAVAASVLGVLAYRSGERAKQERDLALLRQSRLLVAHAQNLAKQGDYGTAIGLAHEALESGRAQSSPHLLADAERALFDAVGGLQELALLSGHDGSVNAAAFSPDGQRAATASADQSVRLWDLKTRAQIAVITGHAGEVGSVAFSPDGHKLVTASNDGTARVWDVERRQQLAVLRGHQNVVWSAAFDPAGVRIVTASADRSARIWDAETGKQVLALPEHREQVRQAAFSADGKTVLTASWDRTVRLWDAETGRELAAIAGLEHEFRGAAFSPDGSRIVTASMDTTARIWDVATRRQLAVLRHDGTVNRAVFSRDGSRIVTASWDNTARLWDASTGQQLGILGGHDAPVITAEFTADGRHVLTASLDGTARLWSLDPDRNAVVLRGHEDEVWSAAFSPDGRRVVTASGRSGGPRPIRDSTARIWDAESGALLTVLRGHADTVWTAVFSGDGRSVLTASVDGTARIWDAQSGAPIKTTPRVAGGLSSAAFSPDGRRIAASALDGTGRVWEVETMRELAVFKGHKNPNVWTASFSPDGRSVVTASWDGSARIWDAESGRELKEFVAAPRTTVSSVAFSPDGRRLVTGAQDKRARIWDIASGQLLRVIEGHADAVPNVAFSPDGRQVATASRDRTARTWDAETGQELRVISGHANQLWNVAFSPDGQRLVTASADRTARITRIFPTTAALAVYAQQVVPRCLTPAQRASFSVDPAPPAWCAANGKWPYHKPR